MNSFKGFYLTWFLIILIVFSFGLFFFSETPETKPETVETPTPVLTPKEQRINELLNSLTLEQKIGQLILAKVPEINIIEDIQQYSLGGYLIFGKDTHHETIESFTQKINTWQTASSTPMIIASDEEGGIVTRVSDFLPEPFDSPGSIYMTGGLELLKQKEFEKAQLLKSLGLNVNLAPVADVAVNPASFIYPRTLQVPPETSLQDAAAQTAQYVTTVVQEYNKVPLGSCLKHFPGYGENPDSHQSVINDMRTLDILQTIDFIPFQAGIQAGAGSVLISHNVCTAIDPTQPASLSPAVHSLLRNDFKFNGVIMCDDLDMKGLTNFADTSSAAIQTINSGTDMIICSNYQEIIPRIKSELESGGISQERFNDAVYHILKWKYDLGLL